jgi:integrase
LTRDNVLAWMRWLSDGRSPATVNSKRRALLTLWREAAEQGLCEPPPKIPKLKEPQRIPVAWTLGEIERIFAATEELTGEWDGVPVGLCWRIALLVFWDTGCRLGAVLGARLANVDMEAGTLFVPAEHLKGQREDRIFRLHPQTVAMIWESLPSEREMLFPYPYSHHRIWRYLKRILRSAGLPCDRHRMFHCFRRTAESYAAAERGIEWAASAIGHSVEVAKQSYVSPQICKPPALIDALPRPTLR